MTPPSPRQIPGAHEKIQENSQSSLKNILKIEGIVANEKQIANIESAIQKNPEIKDYIQKDIAAIQGNPIEKRRVELIYLQGYGQKVRIHEQEYSFIDIQKLQQSEQKSIIEAMNRTDRLKFKNWEREWRNEKKEKNNENENVENQEKEKNNENENVENQEKEKNNENENVENRDIERLNQNLDPIIKRTQAISGVPKPTQAELQARSGNIPELANISPSKRTEKKYENILLADYYIANQNAINAKLSPESQRQFRQSIRIMSDMLNKKQTLSFDQLTHSLVLGNERKNIESLGNNLIQKQGYHPKVVWDPIDRSITFTNDYGEKRIIDTTSTPPIERIEAYNLSFLRNIEKPTISPSEQQQEIFTKNTEKIVDTAIHKPTNGFLFSKIQNYPNIQETFKKAQQTESIPEKLELSRQGLQEKGKLLWNEIQQGNNEAASNETKSMKFALDHIQSQIAHIEQTMQSYQHFAETSLQKNQQEKDDFEITGRKTLAKIRDLGYDALGQENLSSLLRAWKFRDGGNGIWKGEQINLESQLDRNIQLHALRDFAHRIAQTSKKSQRDAFRDIANSLRIDEKFRTLWHNPKRLNAWITEKIPL